MLWRAALVNISFRVLIKLQLHEWENYYEYCFELNYDLFYLYFIFTILMCHNLS